MGGSMIEAIDLCKWYGPVRAVERVSFTVAPGKVVGFLGPNGAGKSTTMRMLCGLLPPTAGSARIAGHDAFAHADAARRSLGYLPEHNPLYPELRVEEYLSFAGRLTGMRRSERRRRIGEVVERCGLLPVRRRTIGRLSKGNRQRVGLAAALLHEPGVLILDEPTSGLDPTQVIELRKLIRELAGGHTVLLSTHILSEVQSVCDEAIIIARGRVVAAGTVEQLRQQAGGTKAPIVVECKATIEQATHALQGLAGEFTRPSAQDGGWLRFAYAPSDQQDMREIIANALHKQGIAVREITRESASLEAFFVQVTDPRSQLNTQEMEGMGPEGPQPRLHQQGGGDA